MHVRADLYIKSISEFEFTTKIRATLAFVFCIIATLFLFMSFSFVANDANAQALTLSLDENNQTFTSQIFQLISLITILSLAPSILIMVTSFTRFVVVLSLLRAALGTQYAPPNVVLISLALFLSLFVMAPILKQSYDVGVKPLMENQIEPQEAFTLAAKPIHSFMLKHVREKDLGLFMDMSGAEKPATPDEISLHILTPAFMISELRRAFEIGFLLFLPFIIIDMVVASVLMSMGMMMLPPIMISLPFKLIFFIMIDGWHLVASSLVQSFN